MEKPVATSSMFNTVSLHEKENFNLHWFLFAFLMYHKNFQVIGKTHLFTAT